MVADALLLVEPGVGAQPQHVVVGEARAAERPGELLGLLLRRVGPESVGAFDVHGSHYARFACNMQVEPPCCAWPAIPPRPERRGFSRRNG